MIIDTAAYKAYLVKVALWLEGGVIARESTLLKLERELFLSFFYIRKMIESEKLSVPILAQTHQLAWHPVVAEVDHLNWHRLDGVVEFETVRYEARNLEFICNRFVHSFIFAPCIEAGKVSELLIATDRDRADKVFRVPLCLIRALLESVGIDDAEACRWGRKQNGQLERK